MTAATHPFSAPLNAWLVDGVRTPLVDRYREHTRRLASPPRG